MTFPRMTAAGSVLVVLAACSGGDAPDVADLEQAPVSAEEQAALQEQANMGLADEWWRTVLQAGRTELADQFMTEDYIQHDPNIDTGRAGLLAASFIPREPRDIPPTLDPAPVVQFAKGPYVVYVWEHEGEDPNDGSTYLYNSFDVVRVENGMVQEHWTSEHKTSTEVVEPGIGPRPVSPPSTPEEQANEDLARVEFKDILQYGHVELAENVMTPGYIQHNPNVPTGRDGFVGFVRQFVQPEPIMDEWKREPELTLATGDIVLYMFKRFSEDPADASRVYKWNWFDMVRIEDGLIAEHWDQATRTPPPASMPVPAGFQEYR